MLQANPLLRPSSTEAYPCSQFSATQQLLLQCTRSQPAFLDLTAIARLLAQDICWETFTTLAQQQGLVPMICQALYFLEVKAQLHIPAAVLQTLQKQTQLIALRNTTFTSALLQIVQLLADHDIPVLTFKGPVLAIAIYQQVGLRWFSDLDLLVRPQDFLKAFDLLLEHGYRPAYEWRLLEPKLERFIRRTKAEYPLTNGIIAIDLHQCLTVERFLSSEFTFEHLWSRRTSIAIAGESIPSFGTADLLMYLGIHGSKDGWRSLKWICDVAAFVRTHPGLDWSVFLAEAEQFGCDRMVLVGLQLAHSLLALPLPAPVQTAIANDTEVQPLTQIFIDRLFNRDRQLTHRFSFTKFAIHFRLVKRPQDKWLCLLDLNRQVHALWIKTLPNIEDLNFLTLPPQAQFLYYVIRPFRLAIKYLTADSPKSPKP